VVQLDVRGEHIGRRVPVDVALVGTVKDTITALMHVKGANGCVAVRRRFGSTRG
jgi:thiamine pyrophosphate-dependent acetolactate synthase large subunit-like protein